MIGWNAPNVCLLGVATKKVCLEDDTEGHYYGALQKWQNAGREYCRVRIRPSLFV